MKWLGFDIGGANIKIADGEDFAAAVSYPLWKNPLGLTQVLRRRLAESPQCDHLAFTMTGELADCFGTKDEGVRFILTCIIEAAAGRHVRVFLNDGRLVSPQVALIEPIACAASNWRALAQFSTRFVSHGTAMLVDIGSTTVDLVPIAGEEVIATATNDTDRLLAGELVYTGVERSPICGLVTELPYRGQMCPVAQELFATTRDVWMLKGDLPERPNSKDTADGRPATKGAARARIGRMICADSDQFNHRDAVVMAEAAAGAQIDLVARSMRKVIAQMPSPPELYLISGHGEFLARRAIQKLGRPARQISLVERLGEARSRCATAYALAVLAREAVEP